MASALTLGRKETDKDNVGGIKALYFANFDSDNFGNATISGDEVTAFSTAVALFKYELRGNNTFDETNTGSRANGTTFWAGTGTIQLKKQSKTTQAELKLMAQDRKHIIIEYYNGDFRIVGLEHGCEINVGTASGSAMGDFNGYNITFTSEERNPAYYVASGIIGDTTNTSVTEGS